jgi:hypothetical protein
MTHRKDIIIVPHWVHESLHRNGMNLSECLDFEKIRAMFAQADLVQFLAAQYGMGNIVGDANFGTGNAYAVLWDAWYKSAITAEAKTLLMNAIMPMSADQTFQQAARDRLFSPEAKRSRDEEAFITYDIAPEVGAIVVYPGHFTSAVLGELQVRALSAILKVLYVYNTQHEVSRTPWFRQYLTGLSLKQAAA